MRPDHYGFEPCHLPHQKDMPTPTVTITFPDGSYYQMGMSTGEAALIMAEVCRIIGMKPFVYNSEGERLGVGTDNHV